MAKPKHERVLAGSNDNVYGRPAVTCFDSNPYVLKANHMHSQIRTFLSQNVGPRCDKPLGLKNGRIHANQLTAASIWDRNHGANNARLHWRRTGARTGAWSARHNNHYQWLQVDFKRYMRIIKIATQGRQDARQWVTKYYVRYSQDCAHFADYEENSNRKVTRNYLQ